MQVVIIHGGEYAVPYDAYVELLRTKEVSLDRLRPRTDWKATLTSELGPMFDILTPRMPLASNAPYDLWELWFSRCAELFDDAVVLVGHSLGGIFLAKYLATHTVPFKVSSLHLVAAPCRTDEEIPDAWRLPQDLSCIEKQTDTIHIYHSTDDPIVHPDNAQEYKKSLPSAVLHTFSDRGHFLTDSFPELIDNIVHNE